MAVPDTCSRIIKLRLPLLLLAFWSCVSEIQGPSAGVLSIDNFVVDYDQVNQVLFLQVENTGDVEIESAWVSMTVDETELDTLFYLNDQGENGDLLPQNGIYSILQNIELDFLKHSFTLFAVSLNGEIATIISSFTNTEEFAPEIVGVNFWKKFLDGSGYMIDEFGSFLIDSTETTFLDFQVKVRDDNGTDDIRFVRYEINVIWDYWEDDCEYDPNQGYVSSPVYFMEYLFTSDSLHIFDLNNEYITEPGFEISPRSNCNRYGNVLFRFTVADYEFSPVIYETILPFSTCGQGSWNCEDECEACTMECGDCSE